MRQWDAARYNALAMRVSVKLFAVARERAGTSSAWLDLPGNATVQDALDELGRCFTKLPPVLLRAMVAVNREYQQREHRLKDGDELAVIPPVSGGSLAGGDETFWCCRCQFHRGPATASAVGVRR
jgi:molybdopterin converting factor subunit 1